MKSAYIAADDFCEGRYTLKGGYAFTVDELETALNAFADSRIEEAAQVLLADANQTGQAALTYRRTQGSPPPEHFYLRADHSLFLAAQVRALKSSGPGER